MNRKIITLILWGLLIIASLLVCGYYGLRSVRRIRLRREAMTAYENKEYELAERLLQQYVQKVPNAEEGFVALANIYHEFGNMGMESQMWQSATSLNPEDPEYRANMLNSMVQSADYALLRGILGRKAKVDDPFTDQELYLFVISSYRADYPKDGEDAYLKAVEADPEAFHKNDLGRMAEFLATYKTVSEGDRDIFLSAAMQSDIPEVRFEAYYTAIRRLEQRDDDSENEGEIERLLKQAVYVNHFAGTPLLSDYYFSKYRFAEAADVLGPYLKTIDDVNLYLLYAESCFFTGRRMELIALEKKLRQKSDSLELLADYCEILTAYLEKDDGKLAVAVRKSGKLIDSPLSRFIRLRVAMANESFNEILTVAQELFSNPPFYDLHQRAIFICLDYISKEMKKPENRKDPSQIADLAEVLSGYLHGNKLLTEIILTDQHRSGLVNEADLTAALRVFPDDALLQRITAEYLILNGKTEQALSVIDPVLESMTAAKEDPDLGIMILKMLALDQLGEHDEAADVFRELVELSGFDHVWLEQYFRFCVKHNRVEDLASMADKLDLQTDGNLKLPGNTFRAAAMLATEDESKEKEALDLLASTPDDDPDFTFYAANTLFKYGRLDDAEKKYNAILETYHFPSLPYVNLSNLYHAKGEEKKAMDAAKKAFELDKESMLPAFTYAKRLSEAERYEDAVNTLNFPRYAVDYREDIIELWRACMRPVIEKSIAERKFLQAEHQCKHLLIIAPEDEFGAKKLAEVLELLFPKDEDPKTGDSETAVPAA